VNIDPLLVIGLIMLGMAMGAVLSHLRFKASIRRLMTLERRNAPTAYLSVPRLPEHL